MGGRAPDGGPARHCRAFPAARSHRLVQGPGTLAQGEAGAAGLTVSVFSHPALPNTGGSSLTIFACPIPMPMPIQMYRGLFLLTALLSACASYQSLPLAPHQRSVAPLDRISV